jgi:hypothetical protein
MISSTDILLEGETKSKALAFRLIHMVQIEGGPDLKLQLIRIHLNTYVEPLVVAGNAMHT